MTSEQQGLHGAELCYGGTSRASWGGGIWELNDPEPSQVKVLLGTGGAGWHGSLGPRQQAGTVHNTHLHAWLSCFKTSPSRCFCLLPSGLLPSQPPRLSSFGFVCPEDSYTCTCIHTPHINHLDITSQADFSSPHCVLYPIFPPYWIFYFAFK